MTEIKVGQLVRIEAVHKKDACYESPELVRMLIGKTGRFVIREDGRPLASWYKGTYAGEFEFDPDELNHNQFRPCFMAIYVEPVEEQNEQKEN